jgi:hypothetical protein
MAADIAPLLDQGVVYMARVKKVLDARRGPLPIILAEFYGPDCGLPGMQAAGRLPYVAPPAKKEIHTGTLLLWAAVALALALGVAMCTT